MIKFLVLMFLLGLLCVLVLVDIILLDFINLIIFFEVVYYVYKWDDNLGFVKILLEELFEGFYLLIYQFKVFKFFLLDKCFEYFIFMVEGDYLVLQQYNYLCIGIGLDKSLKVEFFGDDGGQI